MSTKTLLCYLHFYLCCFDPLLLLLLFFLQYSSTVFVLPIVGLCALSATVWCFPKWWESLGTLKCLFIIEIIDSAVRLFVSGLF